MTAAAKLENRQSRLLRNLPLFVTVICALQPLMDVLSFWQSELGMDNTLTLALRFCDRFLLMRDGQVYRCGGLEGLDKTALREVYGVDAEPVVVNGRHIVLVNE